MSTPLHLTPAYSSHDSEAGRGFISATPAANTGRLHASNVKGILALPLAEKVSGPTGVRFSIRAGAHAVDDIFKPLPSVATAVAPAAATPVLAASKPAEVKAVSPSTRKTILIADDEINIRESLAVILREENYTVRLAENGREAVREFLAGSPDLILLDLNMPDTDGWKAFDVIARLAPDVPVIVVTARPGQARRSAEAGIDMLLEKPLDIPVLLETIRNLLASPETSSFARVLRAWRTNNLIGTQG